MKSKLLKINKSNRSHELKVEAKKTTEHSWFMAVLKVIGNSTSEDIEIVAEKISKGKKNYYVYSSDFILKKVKKALVTGEVVYWSRGE